MAEACSAGEAMCATAASASTDPHHLRRTPNKKPNISTTASGIELISSKNEQPDVGLEPTTLRLRVSRATDCASRACCCLMKD